MRVTEKDRELMRLIERWGFLTIVDVQLICNQKKTAVQWRLSRLVKIGLLRREKIVLTGEFAYLPKNAKRGVNIMEFEHDQTVKRFAMYLKAEGEYNPEAPEITEIITEKELRHAEALESGILGLSRKVPDFILKTADGRKIAVEVELTAKHKPILKAHIKKCGESILQNKFDMILYACDTEAIKKRVEDETSRQGLQSRIISFVLPSGIINYTGGWPWPPEAETKGKG